MLLGQLGGGVHGAGVGGSVLADRPGGQRPPARRAQRFEAARVQVGDGPRARPHHAVERALVPALPVHDHRAREDEPPYAGSGHGGEQDGGPEVVAGDVLRRVGDAVAEPDHGRLVTDGVDAREGTGDGRGVAHIGAGILPDVVHERFVAVCPQGVHDMGPDEPGTAGDQYTHTATLGPGPSRAARPDPHVITP